MALPLDGSLTKDIPITSDLANRIWFQYASSLAAVILACTDRMALTTERRLTKSSEKSYNRDRNPTSNRTLHK
jgi:hypothetical protein